MKLCNSDRKPCPAPVDGKGPGNSRCEQNGICQRVSLDALPTLKANVESGGLRLSVESPTGGLAEAATGPVEEVETITQRLRDKDGLFCDQDSLEQYNDLVDKALDLARRLQAAQSSRPAEDAELVERVIEACENMRRDGEHLHNVDRTQFVRKPEGGA